MTGREKPVTTDLSDLKITLKVATSLDGKIATHAGHSQWITGPEARAEVHRIRSSHDAVLTGVGTVLADNPQMNVRGVEDSGRQPARIILDSTLRTQADAAIVTAQGGPTHFMASEQRCKPDRIEGMRAAGALVHLVADEAETGALGIDDVCKQLSVLGFSSVMIEAGAKIAASFLIAGRVDRIEWFRAPMIIGGDGLPVFGGLDVADLSAAFRYQRTGVRSVGDDLWETYEKRKAE